MKKFTLLAICIVTLSNLASAQKKLTPKQPNYKTVGAPLPPFVLEKTTGGTFTNTNLKKGKPIMLMIFSPQCDHCEHMMDSLKNISGMFKNTQLILVAEDRNKQYMKDFIKKTSISSNSLFKNVGTERGNLIYYIYDYKILPQVNFYNSNYKLVKTFTGTSPLDSIKMFIH